MWNDALTEAGFGDPVQQLVSVSAYLSSQFQSTF